MISDTNITGILIADSGSTKTDWVFIDSFKTTTKYFTTRGLNPNILDDTQLFSVINNNSELRGLFNANIDLFFYGAGCSGSMNRERMRSVLETLFIHANIEVKTDIEAAVYATCKAQNAIVAILGTGSNSCLFYDNKISGENFSLGYILGDEGSGNYFGKILLRDYFYGKLPEDLHSIFKQKYSVTREEVIDRIYKQPFPNEYIASFLPFFSEFIEHPYCEKIISEGLDKFLIFYILRFKEHSTLPVHFAGSVAFYFREQLVERASEYGITIAGITEKPIQGLADYHTKK